MIFILIFSTSLEPYSCGPSVPTHTAFGSTNLDKKLPVGMIYFGCGCDCGCGSECGGGRRRNWESGGVKSLEVHNENERMADFSTLLVETKLYPWIRCVSCLSKDQERYSRDCMAKVQYNKWKVTDALLSGDVVDKCATRNFHNPIMRSGRGWVTKGWVDKNTYSPSKLDVRLAISVIQLRSSTQWGLHLLSQFCHPNLVKLLGYCLQDKTLYLVHEFMDKRSLRDYLRKGAAIELSFSRRVKISVGVARGLAFLQIKQLLPRKWVLQMRDIWLDKDINTRLLDFDVAKLIHRFNTLDRLTYESTAAGKPIPGKVKMDILEENYLCAEVAKMSNNMIEDVVDRRLVLSAPEIECAHELLSLIRKCTRYHFTMEEALKKLEQIYSRVT
ncbi:serine/threonine/dual specificity protein kinase, catalytic domain-containing protein [Tanacetum coccineum]